MLSQIQAYDDVHQLTEAVHASQPTESYTYDATGNRAGQAGSNNQLISDGAAYYDYDAEGNRIKRTDIATGEITRYEYDHRNRLITVRQMQPVEPLEGDGSGWGWGSLI